MRNNAFKISLLGGYRLFEPAPARLFEPAPARLFEPAPARLFELLALRALNIGNVENIDPDPDIGRCSGLLGKSRRSLCSRCSLCSPRPRAAVAGQTPLKLRNSAAQPQLAKKDKIICSLPRLSTGNNTHHRDGDCYSQTPTSGRRF